MLLNCMYTSQEYYNILENENHEDIAENFFERINALKNFIFLFSPNDIKKWSGNSINNRM